MTKTAIGLLVFVTMLTACKHQLDQPILPPGGGGGVIVEEECDEDIVYFNTIQAILGSNCMHEGCHNPVDAEEGIILNNYDNITAGDLIVPGDLGDSEIYEAITESDPDKIMPEPPYPALSPDEINLIATWIQQGAQNIVCYDCDTTNVTFQNSISPLIQLYCEDCHSGPDPDAGLSLTNYDEIAASANSQAFEDQILQQNGAVGMPYNNWPLPQCRIDQLMIWIEAGTPNN